MDSAHLCAKSIVRDILDNFGLQGEGWREEEREEGREGRGEGGREEGKEEERHTH